MILYYNSNLRLTAGTAPPAPPAPPPPTASPPPAPTEAPAQGPPSRYGCKQTSSEDDDYALDGLVMNTDTPPPQDS